MPPRRSLSLFLSLIAAFADVASSQLPKQGEPPQPLGDVLHLVLDKDKDGKVTLAEVDATLALLEGLVQMAEGEEGEEYRRMLAGAKAAAPRVHELLDSDGDGGLTKAELEYATKFEGSLRKDGGMRPLLRDVFAMFDGDGDDQLSAEELLDGSKSDDVISRASARFHELFPLRETPAELERFVRDVMESVGGDTLDKESVEEGIRWIDDDGDGRIQRKEVGKAYNAAGRKFLEISKTIKMVGPMMAMMGDMGGMDGMGGGGGGGVKTDL